MPLLLVLAASCLVSAMTMRVIDPVVPAVARDFAIGAEQAALLASAFTFPYALGQPLLGAMGDALGKARIIKICLAVLLVCLLAGATAPSIEVLFASRIIGGAAAGGIIPLAFALVGDRFPFEGRQIALSRILAAIITGQLTGSLGSGLLASYFGWRAPMFAGAGLALVALVISLWQLKPRADAVRPRFTLAGMRAGFAQVFANPKSPVCFTVVFIEGIVMFGLFPYIAILLEQRGAGGLKEAGFVLAGFGIGGILYTVFVVSLLRHLGFMNLIRAGGAVAGLGLAGLAAGASWPVEALAFVAVGIGFYMIHNSLQTQATELAPDNRGAAVAAHAFFFFLGQAVGPVVYAAMFKLAGPGVTLVLGAIVMGLLGFATAYGLIARTGPAAAGPV